MGSAVLSRDSGLYLGPLLQNARTAADILVYDYALYPGAPHAQLMRMSPAAWKGTRPVRTRQRRHGSDDPERRGQVLYQLSCFSWNSI